MSLRTFNCIHINRLRRDIIVTFHGVHSSRLRRNIIITVGNFYNLLFNLLFIRNFYNLLQRHLLLANCSKNEKERKPFKVSGVEPPEDRNYKVSAQYEGELED